MLVTSGTGAFGSGASGLIDGNEIIFSRHGRAGEFLNVIARFPADPRWAYTASGRTVSQYLPHSVGWTVHGSWGNRIFLGLGRKPELEVWDPLGEQVGLLRWGAEGRIVGDREVEEYRREWLLSVGDADEKRFWEGWLSEVPFPEALPIFHGLLVDRTGHLWVEDYKPFWDDSHTWTILSPGGAWLGNMETPAAMRVTEIGPDYVLGVWRDELGIEYVKQYRLNRSG
jgi:hypothetical protein